MSEITKCPLCGAKMDLDCHEAFQIEEVEY